MSTGGSDAHSPLAGRLAREDAEPAMLPGGHVGCVEDLGAFATRSARGSSHRVSDRWSDLGRNHHERGGAFPAAALFLPLGFFHSVVSPDATAPNGLIALAYVGALALGVGLVVLGIGLVSREQPARTLDTDGQEVTRAL